MFTQMLLQLHVDFHHLDDLIRIVQLSFLYPCLTSWRYWTGLLSVSFYGVCLVMFSGMFSLFRQAYLQIEFQELVGQARCIYGGA